MRRSLRPIPGALRGCEAGQALVEFALVVPLLLVLVIGVFEFGRAWNAYQVITDAAREGARNAVVTDDTAAVRTKVRNALGNAGLDPNAARIEIARFQDPTDMRATTVAIEYPYSFVFLGPLLGWLTDQSNITLATRFTMRNEVQGTGSNP